MSADEPVRKHDQSIQKYSHLQIDGEMTKKLDAIQQRYGLNTRTKAVRLLLSAFAKDVQERPIATYQAIMDDPRAVAITGLPSEGKSFTLARFLEGCDKAGVPYILFDTVGDHSQIAKTFNFYEFMGYRFTGKAQFRVLLPHDANLRRTAMRQVIDALERAITEGRLSDYVLAFEEAYDFSDLAPFLKFLAKIRKWSRKCVLATVDPDPFRNFCTMMRPLPRLA